MTTRFMNSEQKLILASKPLVRMRWFASLLNWQGLQLERLLFTADEMAEWTLPPPSGIIVFYMTTDEKFNLQINENPLYQSVTHQATIKAARYGIKHIGWHPFTLNDDDGRLIDEVERLRPWLDRKLFKNRQWLREFKLNHPQMLVASRKKHRGRRAPYLR